MQTIFSHIVQKELSQKSENVATFALEFILDSSKAARNGMMKLLRGVVPEMPRLWFRTQQMDGSSRPDMWGNDEEGKPHVFVENKFWAGLTENQPVSYLRILAKQSHNTALLVVVPEARERTVWDELKRRVNEGGISATENEPITGIVHSITTDIRPILALTSWTKLLSFLEHEVAEDNDAKSNLLQLRALCEAVESDAFVPISAEEVFNQRTPAFILQLSSVVQATVELAVNEGVLYVGTLKPQANTQRIGRYTNIGNGKCAGLWIGIHFGLWKKHGRTPLWAVWDAGDWGRATEVRALLEPWAANTTGVFVNQEDNCFVVALDIAFGEEKEIVVRAIVNRLKAISDVLSVLKAKPTANLENEQGS
jgi:hypothetical protein